MAKDHPEPDLEQELEDLPADLRWRAWMRGIEAELFASATLVAREDLARVVGQGVSVDLLIDDLMVESADRPYEIAGVADAWMLRTREADVAVFAAIAYHQPITRDGLKDNRMTRIGRAVYERVS